MKKIHFISGLPRSGSTLLSSILRQNPAFSATITSAVGSLYKALETAMTPRNDAAVLIDAAQRREMLRGLFTGYYHALDRSTVVFDTNRLWCARLPALAGLFPQARVICCVRPVPWIMDSFERQSARNPYELSAMFGYDANGTVYTRMKKIGSSDGAVGFALDAFREACFGDFASRLIVVDYEALARAPGAVMEKLYELLGEPPFKHDFDKVGYETPAYDQNVGAPGLHTVRDKVEWRPRDSILPPELFNSFSNDAFWLRPHPRLACIPKILWSEQGASCAPAVPAPPG